MLSVQGPREDIPLVLARWAPRWLNLDPDMVCLTYDELPLSRKGPILSTYCMRLGSTCAVPVWYAYGAIHWQGLDAWARCLTERETRSAECVARMYADVVHFLLHSRPLKRAWMHTCTA